MSPHGCRTAMASRDEKVSNLGFREMQSLFVVRIKEVVNVVEAR